MSNKSPHSQFEKRVRSHGFQTPFHPLQIISWIYFLLKTATFYTILAPTLHSHSLGLYLSSQVLYALLLFTVVLLAYMATRSDPTDTLIILHRAYHK